MNSNTNQKSKHMLQIKTDHDELIKLIDSVTWLLQQEKKYRKEKFGAENIVYLEQPENIVVVGDIHGDLNSLLKILFVIEYDYFLFNPQNKIVFLGDYIDRGDFSVNVINILFRLKKRYPESIILLCGNHEAVRQFPFSAHDLPKQLRLLYGVKGNETYRKLMKSFAELPLMTVIKDAMILVHGGLPILDHCNFEGNYKTILAKITKSKENIEQLLWNDPKKINSDRDWETSRRGRGYHFGKNITKKWLEVLSSKVVVRGHEPCKGYKIDHEGKIITIFSSKEPYPKFDAGFLNINKEQMKEFIDANDLRKYVVKLV